MATTEALRDAVLALPEEARARLAVDLIDSLDGPADEDAEEAWADEVRARVAALRAGQAEVIPFEEALAHARERLQARRG